MPAKKMRASDRLKLTYDGEEVSVLGAVVTLLEQWASMSMSDDPRLRNSGRKHLERAAKDIIEAEARRFQHAANPGGVRKKDDTDPSIDISDRTLRRRQAEERSSTKGTPR